MVVATELDAATERIINYLADNFGVPINAVFFRYFRDGEDKYIARTWLIDPQDAEAKSSKAAKKKDREPWNGRDFHVSFSEKLETENGEVSVRSWEDARKYGFVSGRLGTWLLGSLHLLVPGARVFVNVAQHGYVGVGTVKESVQPITEFTVSLEGREVGILDVPLAAPEMKLHADDPEKCEVLVRVDWIKTVPKEEAYWESGLFATGHTACRLRNRFTLERLTQHFGLTE